MALSCVETIPSEPLGVDISFVKQHCGSAPWAAALTEGRYAASCCALLPLTLRPAGQAAADLCWLRPLLPLTPAVASVAVAPLDNNGGGLTGATISKLHCTYDPPNTGPATLILKLSDETAMRAFKANTCTCTEGSIGERSAGGSYKRAALIERMMNWGFGLPEHDMSVTDRRPRAMFVVVCDDGSGAAAESDDEEAAAASPATPPTK